MIICFTGIDGSGKTLQARLLVERLNAAGYPASYAWTGGRAYLSRPLIWLGKGLLRAPRVGASAERADGADRAAGRTRRATGYEAYLGSTKRLFRRPWVRALWRQVTLAEHTAEILAAVLPPLARGRIVVCDRYIYDSLIGIAVLAGLGPAEIPAAMAVPPLYRVPRPALWFLLDLPAEAAFARRDDVVDVAFLERRAPLYRAAAAVLDARVLDATATPEAIAAEVWRAVSRRLLAAKGEFA